MLSILKFASVARTSFSPESTFISLVDNRGWIDYSKSICLSLYKECISRQQRANNPLKANAKNIFPILQADGSYSKDLQPWIREESARLIVLIHGLNSSPLCWSKYIQELSEHEKSTNYFAPYVYKKGYCKLREASQPIFDVIQSYANQYPQNPIILIGHSHGARIAQDIEMNLEASNIKLISIAGPHLGSKLVNWITFLGLNSLLGISGSMANKLKYNSNWANKKLLKWQNIKNIDKAAKRVFIASADDLRVFPNNTSFPNLPSSTYFLISGESHVTIVDAVCEKVLAEALQ